MALQKSLPTDEVLALFDALPDVVFFIKDTEGRYLHCNPTLMRRLGRSHQKEVIGRTAVDLFPAPLGITYLAQDHQVARGEVLDNQLEVHLYPNRMAGWCITLKHPLRVNDCIAGIIGISRDLGQPDKRHSSYSRLSSVVDYVHEKFSEEIRVTMLATIAKLSVAQLERQFRRVFQLTPQQFITKVRIQHAMEQLHSAATIASIGQACGFSDQSAFSRKFRAVVGITPRDYRDLVIRSPVTSTESL